MPCPTEPHLNHHPFLFGSLIPSSSTLSPSLPSLCSIQLLQRPHGTRKILGRFWSGGGCEDSLAATGVTVTALVLAASLQKACQPGGTKSHQEHLLPTPRSSAPSQNCPQGVSGGTDGDQGSHLEVTLQVTPWSHVHLAATTLRLPGHPSMRLEVKSKVFLDLFLIFEAFSRPSTA